MTFRERRKKYLVCTLVILIGLGVWKVTKNTKGKVRRESQEPGEGAKKQLREKKKTAQTSNTP